MPNLKAVIFFNHVYKIAPKQKRSVEDDALLIKRTKTATEKR